MAESLTRKASTATKWSALTELMAKLVSPIIGLILAHLLTPEAYGIVATITLVISFVEIFTDAGFQKYIVQHEFQDKQDIYESTNVAFWSNFILSIIIWGGIIIFRDSLAAFVGSSGYGFALAVACVGIPIAAFSSLQVALYRRELNFKPLFKVRMVGVFVPLVITIPLAILFRNYWALIIGTISRNIVEALVLSLYSKWRPFFRYSFVKFKEMFNFTIWMLLDSISIWLSANLDVFIVAGVLTAHYLGLYKTASGLVSQVMDIVIVVSMPVLFSSLSRLQNDKIKFDSFLLNFQRYLTIPVFLIGGIVFVYHDILTAIMLGDQWMEAGPYIGLLGITSSFMIVLSYMCSEAYRAKGLPQISLLVQVIHVLVMAVAIRLAVGYGFTVLYIVRASLSFNIILVNVLVAFFVLKLPAGQMLINLVVPFLAALTMVLSAFFFRMFFTSYVWQFISMALSVCIYFGILTLFKRERLILLNLKDILWKQMSRFLSRKNGQSGL